MPSNVTYQSPNEIAAIIPVFPLPGALLLPRGQMPLNIFEPRYTAMIDMALGTHRLIGMIQPMEDDETARIAPKLYTVGCVGRITQIAETGDGRYVLNLTGICRFKVVRELGGMTPFRQCEVDYAPFAVDLEPRAGESAVDRPALLSALRAFSEKNDIPIDWENVNEAPNEALVNALSMMSPFGIKEKQALLEAPDLKTRSDVLVAITEMELARAGGDGETRVQ
jgi:uncharacterized protein